MIDKTHDLPVARQAKLLELSRSSIYYRPQPTPESDLRLMRRMDELHLDHPFAGARMLRDMLKLEGVEVGRKHVGTLMKTMGIEALYRLFNVIDDFNREALTIDIDLSLPAERVVRALDQVIEWRGMPLAIRSDNGPEYIGSTLANWAQRHGIRLDHIQPGKPQQNAYIERYNRTVRYDWLSHYLFESIVEVQDYATDWMWTYNHERPNMALGGITPKQKLALLTPSTSDRC